MTLGDLRHCRPAAICGVLLEGRNSVEDLLRAGSTILWLIGIIAAGMTSFYMFRLWFLTFFGEYRGPNPRPADMARCRRAACGTRRVHDVQTHATGSHGHGTPRESVGDGGAADHPRRAFADRRMGWRARRRWAAAIASIISWTRSSRPTLRTAAATEGAGRRRSCAEHEEHRHGADLHGNLGRRGAAGLPGRVVPVLQAPRPAGAHGRKRPAASTAWCWTSTGSTNSTGR